MTEPGKNVYAELKTTCDYLKKETRPGAVIMTYPFFAPHFICDRPSVPFPYGTMGTVAAVADKYKPEYIIFSELWPGDYFPDIPFTEPLVRGGRSLFLRWTAKNSRLILPDAAGIFSTG